jgi:hypothetical protein
MVVSPPTIPPDDDAYQLLALMDEHLLEEFFLGLEIAIERAHAYVGLLGNERSARAFKAMFGNEIQRGLHDGLTLIGG